jgi:steroid 5-alpha reductase family enzyme
MFFVQGFLLWFISLPIQRLLLDTSAPDVLPSDIAGGALMTLGLLLESIADVQLVRFGRDPDNKTKVLHHGLWRYSRHPNYFGEWLFWWGVFVISLASGATWPIVSPLLLTVLLLRVSGVSLLERTITSRRPGYEQYIEQTSAFIPWFAPAGLAAAQLDESPPEP